MKKGTFVYFFLYVCTFYTFSLEVRFFTKEKPEYVVVQQFEYNLMKDIRSENSGISTFGKIDAKQLKGFAGFSANSFRTDISMQLSYTPTINNVFSVGPVIDYHFYKFAEDFVDYDFLCGICVSLNLNTGWNFYGSYKYLKKYSIINAVQERIALSDDSMAFTARADFNPNENWQVFIDLSSCDMFEYPLFYDVIAAAGFNRKLIDRMYVNASLRIKWTDVVTITDGPCFIGAQFGWMVKI